METLIIGAGEVGKALYEILSEHYPTNIIDKNATHEGSVDYLHITFPYSDKFVEIVKEYQNKYQPKFTIIHSTVPVGTSRRCMAIHSAIRGVHPNLEEGIRTFPKFLAGEQASEVADYFRRAGLKVILFDKQETSEAAKLLDTEYYRTCVEFCHRVKKFCDKYDLNFHEVYTLPNQSYNEGYAELGHPEYVRPILQPIMKEIGGHCLLPNQKIISAQE